MSRRVVHREKPTRQQRAYRRLKAAGLCVWCGTGAKRKAENGVHCRWCAEKRRAAALTRLKRLGRR